MFRALEALEYFAPLKLEQKMLVGSWLIVARGSVRTGTTVDSRLHRSPLLAGSRMAVIRPKVKFTASEVFEMYEPTRRFVTAAVPLMRATACCGHSFYFYFLD
jgi:hypothetical protein